MTYSSFRVYDKENIFAKILRNEMPCKKIYENNFALSFYDIHPQKNVHALVIPKGPYIDYDHFINNANDDEIIGFFKAISEVSKILKVSRDHDGYRLITNTGKNANQEVAHLHFHIFGGERVGRMINN